jgi:hypothetical protein
MRDRKNPYAPHWYNNILSKRYNLRIKVDRFLNGVPIIKLTKTKNNDLLPPVNIYIKI